MSKHQENRSPFIYFALTIVFSWTFWLPAVLVGFGLDLGFDPQPYIVPLEAVGAFAPLAAALTLVGRRHGRGQIWPFLRQAFDFRVRPVYILLALAFPLSIAAAAHYLAPQFAIPVPDTLYPAEITVSPWLITIPYFFFILLVGGGQEEFGWRGYAQQPLQARLGVLKASLLIGFVWGLWHLPLWFIPGDPHATYSFWSFLTFTVSSAVIYGWLYNASGQKLIVPLVFHAMNNAAAPLFPFMHYLPGRPEDGYWVLAGVTVLVALVAVYFLRREARSAAGRVEAAGLAGA